MNQGAYIVLGGPAGVGKSTQLNRLYKRLQELGYEVQLFKDPDSRTDPVTKELARLLREQQPAMVGTTELLTEVSARIQSVTALQELRQDGVICLVEGDYLSVLADLYYGQGVIKDYDLVDRIVGLAASILEPDCRLLLDAPVQTLIERQAAKNRQSPAVAADAAYLERIRAGYLWEAKQRDLTTIFTDDSIETIADLIWKQVQPVLPDPPATPAGSALEPISAIIQKKKQTPPVPPITTEQFSELPTDSANVQTSASQADLLAVLSDELSALAERTTREHNLSDSQRQQLLPVHVLAADLGSDVAWNTTEEDDTSNSRDTQTLTHGDALRPHLRLIRRSPLNELDSVMSYISLKAPVDQGSEPLSYADKLAFLEHANSATLQSVLASIDYQWDVVADYADLLQLHTAHGAQLDWRSLTPRNGFITPAEFDEAAADAYADSFDASLQAFSKLQAAERGVDAQQVTLGGHLQACQVSLTGAQLYAAWRSSATDASSASLITQMLISIEVAHPLVAEAIRSKT